MVIGETCAVKTSGVLRRSSRILYRVLQTILQLNQEKSAGAKHTEPKRRNRCFLKYPGRRGRECQSGDEGFLGGWRLNHIGQLCTVTGIHFARLGPGSDTMLQHFAGGNGSVRQILDHYFQAMGDFFTFRAETIILLLVLADKPILL